MAKQSQMLDTNGASPTPAQAGDFFGEWHLWLLLTGHTDANSLPVQHWTFYFHITKLTYRPACWISRQGWTCSLLSHSLKISFCFPRDLDCWRRCWNHFTSFAVWLKWIILQICFFLPSQKMHLGPLLLSNWACWIGAEGFLWQRNDILSVLVWWCLWW